LHVAKRVLLNGAKVAAKFYEVSSPRVARVVQRLKHVRGAALRIVELVAQRRETRNRDEAESEVSRVCPKLRKSNFVVYACAGFLLSDCLRDPAVCELRLVHQTRRKNVRLSDHEVLTAPGNVVSKAGYECEGRTGERVKQQAIGEAVPCIQLRGACDR